MTVKINGYSLQAEPRIQSGSSLIYPLDGATVSVCLFITLLPCFCFFPDTCYDVFHEWMVQDRRPSQCGLWEATAPRRKQAAKLAKFMAFKHGMAKPICAVDYYLYYIVIIIIIR